MAAAETMTVRDGDRLVQSGFSFVHGIDVYYQLQGTTLFNQAGARVLSEDGTEAAINSPESRRVFEFWRDVVHTYGVSEPGFTSTFYTDEFGTGRVAMGWMYVVGQLDPRAVGLRERRRLRHHRSADVRR